MIKTKTSATGNAFIIEKNHRIMPGLIQRAHEKGSILISLIVTMVIMASLGAAMITISTTTAYQELMTNHNASAYYAAESGGRFALAEIRDAYSTSLSKVTNLKTNLEKTYAIGSGRSFTIQDLMSDGGNPATVTFTSVGKVGSGFMAVNKHIRYSVSPANQTMNPIAKIFSATDMDTTSSKGSFGTVATGANAGAIKVLTTVDNGNGQFFADAYFNSSVNFLDVWNAQGQSLSYDAQVKVKSEKPAYYYSAGLGFRLHTVSSRPKGFHVDFMRFSTFANPDGISSAFYTASPWVGEMKHPDMEVGATYIILWMDEEWSQWEILLAYKKLDEVTSGVMPVPKFLDNMESGINEWTIGGSNPWGWNTNDNNTDNTGNKYGATPHSWNIDLTANSETSTLTSKQINASSIATTGELSFAYKVTNHTVNATGTVQICTSAGATNCTTVFTLPAGTTLPGWGLSAPEWMHTTIAVPSGITLTSTTYIKFVATTGISQRLTWYVDDVTLVQAAPMPDWSTILVQLEEKNMTKGDPSTRRNVIKTYYSTPVSSPLGNTTTDHVYAYDDNRLGSNPVGVMNWPATTGNNQNFTLVNWDWIQLNYTYNATTVTNIDNIADKTVVQTKWYRTYPSGTTRPDTTSGWYNVTNSYDEVGLCLFGAWAAVNNNVFFKDFALRIAGTGGNNSGSGTVVQY